MAENSKIEWCHHTFNPWEGCDKVSPACDFCYAAARDERFHSGRHWGPKAARRKTSPANWAKPLKWDREAKASGVRSRIFCLSLGDWLDNKVPREWRADLCRLICKTQHLNWLLLTKRPQNLAALSPWTIVAPGNIWLGVTAENQEELARRWRYVAAAPANVRFISYEPALGPLDITGLDPLPDWVIAGGESGPNRRPSDIEWFYSIKEQCRYTDTAFFMKQMTGRVPIPGDLMVREYPYG